LDQLLQAHAALAILTMEAAYHQSPMFSAWNRELNLNTEGLANAVASIYGQKAGVAFKAMWAGHIVDFLNYARAARAHDAAAQQVAKSDLARYGQQFSAFMASADPHISASALSASLAVHVQQILAAFDDYVDGQYAKSASEFVTAYDHMDMAGGYLAGAISAQFPNRFGTMGVNTPEGNLQIALDNLLGAHAVLAQLAMQAGYHGWPMYAAWAAALNRNTAELSSAIASIYGKKAGAAFQTMWNGHVVDFVDYTIATKEHNPKVQHGAIVALSEYRTQFARFLAGADPKYIQASAISASLQVHIRQILATFHAVVANRPQLMATDFVTAYNHMFMDGAYLSSAIAAQFPSKFAP
jgi:hypothetical protein